MSFPHRLPCIALATPHVRTPWWDIMLTDCKPPHAAPHVSLCTTSLMAGVGHHKQHLTQPRAEAPVRDFGSRAPRRPSLHQTFHLTLQSMNTSIAPQSILLRPAAVMVWWCDGFAQSRRERRTVDRLRTSSPSSVCQVAPHLQRVGPIAHLWMSSHLTAPLTIFAQLFPTCLWGCHVVGGRAE
jgi:hypothetical protein